MLRSRIGRMLLCVALLASTAGVFAEDAPKPEKEAKPKPAKTVGTVAAVGADSITVAPKAMKAKKGEEAATPEPITFAVAEATQVKVDGQKANLAEVRAGYAVTVMAHEGEPAMRIDALSPQEQARRAEEKKAKAEEKKKAKENEKAEGEQEGM